MLRAGQFWRSCVSVVQRARRSLELRANMCLTQIQVVKEKGQIKQVQDFKSARDIKTNLAQLCVALFRNTPLADWEWCIAEDSSDLSDSTEWAFSSRDVRTLCYIWRQTLWNILKLGLNVVRQANGTMFLDESQSYSRSKGWFKASTASCCKASCIITKLLVFIYEASYKKQFYLILLRPLNKEAL